jgi:hypothetical protein
MFKDLKEKMEESEDHPGYQQRSKKLKTSIQSRRKALT